MNSRNEQKLTMFRTTRDYMDANAAGMGLSILVAYTSDMTDQIGYIDAALVESDVSTIPITTSKKDARLAVVLSASTIASASYAYALDINDIILQEQLKPYRTLSSLSTLKDELLTPQAQIIHDLILPIVTVIAPAINPLIEYGVTAPGVAALQGLIDAYMVIIDGPYAAIENRKTKNQEINDILFPVTDDLLFKIDNVMYAAKSTYPEIVEGYFNARNIFDPVVTHTKIKGNITAVLTGLPIQGVKVTAIAQQTLFPGDPVVDPIIVFTDELGNYTMPTPKFKYPYTVIWTKTGLAEQQQTDVYVKRGKPTTINVIMEPVTP